MIQLGVLSDFSDSERSQLQAACDCVNTALLDQKFISILLRASFANTDDSSGVVTGKLCSPIIITRLYCEKLSWWATHVSQTIAFEEPDGTVTFNRAYFDLQSLPSLGNTLFHEACHTAGYSHRSSTDYSSVPYLAGTLMESYLSSDTRPTQPFVPTVQPSPLPAYATGTTAFQSQPPESLL